MIYVMQEWADGADGDDLVFAYAHREAGAMVQGMLNLLFPGLLSLPRIASGGSTWAFQTHPSYDAVTTMSRRARASTPKIYVEQVLCDAGRFALCSDGERR